MLNQVLVGGLLMFASFAAAAWKFEVDPAVKHGRPAVVAKAGTNTSEPLCLRIYAITETTSTLLVEKLIQPQASVRLEAPVVHTPQVVEFALTTSTCDQRSAFLWRTLAMPKGKRLIAYRGKKTFPPPPDFETYWTQAKADLAKVPLDPIVERVPDKDTSTGLLHKVTLPTIGNTRIVCWYYVPRDAFDAQGRVRKTYPAVVIMPGYGAEEPPIDRTSSGVITLSVNPRNHGPSREYWQAPVEHLLWNIDDPENFYYRFAFLDCLRAAQFLFTRAEVDPKRVASEGGSQGGLFALALAALEPRIACVASNVTAFSAYGDAMLLALSGHQTQYAQILEDHPTSASLIKASLAYTDGANMATLIRCPVQINMGGVDPVCNYVSGIIIYNQLAPGVPREYNVLPECGHAVPPPMRSWNQAWYKRWLRIP
ncbi:MAG: acetylxylan esterase [Candidatus Sumerlaeaceae bacterium]